MIPQRFPEANTVMRRPANMTEEECLDVHAYVDGTICVTAWRPTPAELVKINLGEPVYLMILGRGMPPALVTADCPIPEQPGIELLGKEGA